MCQNLKCCWNCKLHISKNLFEPFCLYAYDIEIAD